nr:hypothetical protein CFP56_58244 [Quercus suber]
MLPFGGQGANQAIEDAGALGCILGSVQDCESMALRLQIFESVRIKRASTIQVLSKVRAGREKEVEKELVEFLEPGSHPPGSLMARNVHAYRPAVRPLAGVYLDSLGPEPSSMMPTSHAFGTHSRSGSFRKYWSNTLIPSHTGEHTGRGPRADMLRSSSLISRIVACLTRA